MGSQDQAVYDKREGEGWGAIALNDCKVARWEKSLQTKNGCVNSPL